MKKISNESKSWREIAGSRGAPNGSESSLASDPGNNSLVASLVAFGWIAWTKLNDRKHQLILMSMDGNWSDVGEGIPDRFACPPLRFTKTCLDYLTRLPRGNKNVLASETLPLNLKKFASQIQKYASEYHRADDMLVVHLQAQGMSLANKPYLLGAHYELPDSPGWWPVPRTPSPSNP